MKLPWDKNYFKISFYCVLGAIVFYVLKLSIDSFAIILSDIDKVANGLRLVVLDLFRILSPLIMSFVIAYLLDPVVEWFQNLYDKFVGNNIKLKAIKKRFKALSKKFKKIAEKYKTKKGVLRQKDIEEKNKDFSSDNEKSKSYPRRTAGVILTYIAIILIILTIYIFIRDFTKKDISLAESLAHRITSLINQLGDMIVLIRLKLISWHMSDFAQNFLDNIVDRLNKLFSESGEEIINSLLFAGRLSADLFFGFVIGFYFLQRKAELLEKSAQLGKILLPAKLYKLALKILRDLNTVFSGYIRGQITDAIIMATLISSGLKLLGVDFAIAIGILTGFSNLIPFLGALIGFGLSVTMALITGSMSKAVYVAIFMLVVQQIDALFIVPRVVGRKVSLSPVAVILAVVIGAKIAGIFGMLFAVPVFSLGKIWFEDLLQNRLSNSDYYGH